MLLLNLFLVFCWCSTELLGGNEGESSIAVEGASSPAQGISNQELQKDPYLIEMVKYYTSVMQEGDTRQRDFALLNSFLSQNTEKISLLGESTKDDKEEPVASALSSFWNLLDISQILMDQVNSARGNSFTGEKDALLSDVLKRLANENQKLNIRNIKNLNLELLKRPTDMVSHFVRMGDSRKLLELLSSPIAKNEFFNLSSKPQELKFILQSSVLEEARVYCPDHVLEDSSRYFGNVCVPRLIEAFSLITMIKNDKLMMEVLQKKPEWIPIALPMMSNEMILNLTDRVKFPKTISGDITSLPALCKVLMLKRFRANETWLDPLLVGRPFNATTLSLIDSFNGNRSEERAFRMELVRFAQRVKRASMYLPIQPSESSLFPSEKLQITPDSLWDRMQNYSSSFSSHLSVKFDIDWEIIQMISYRLSYIMAPTSEDPITSEPKSYADSLSEMRDYRGSRVLSLDIYRELNERAVLMPLRKQLESFSSVQDKYLTILEAKASGKHFFNYASNQLEICKGEVENLDRFQQMLQEKIRENRRTSGREITSNNNNVNIDNKNSDILMTNIGDRRVDFYNDVDDDEQYKGRLGKAPPPQSATNRSSLPPSPLPQQPRKTEPEAEEALDKNKQSSPTNESGNNSELDIPIWVIVIVVCSVFSVFLTLFTSLIRRKKDKEAAVAASVSGSSILLNNPHGGGPKGPASVSHLNTFMGPGRSVSNNPRSKSSTFVAGGGRLFSTADGIFVAPPPPTLVIGTVGGGTTGINNLNNPSSGGRSSYGGLSTRSSSTSNVPSRNTQPPPTGIHNRHVSIDIRF